MAAGELNITIEKGSTFNPTLTWKDSSGAVIDLTGYTARMQIREDIDNAAKITELTTENGGITLGDAAGTIELLITATESADITQLTGFYDLELVSGDVVTRLLKGSVIFSPEVTR